jgi:dimethylhistidine N-methyltransferase
MSAPCLSPGPASPLPAGQTSHGFAHSLLEGLTRAPKEISCKYFYDTEGSALFDAICALPEYYQTRTEVALLRRHAPEIARLIGPDAEIVEFGAGSLRKIRVLLDALAEPRGYMPIDISGPYLRDVVQELAEEYPTLPIHPVVADFTQGFALPSIAGTVRRAGFFPGSTIGNFRSDAAAALLKRMRDMLAGGGLLIGVDLVKDPQILHSAYNDAAGVTAAFNKNLLARANRDLGADFDLDGFAHYAPYNPYAQRIEMYLMSLKRQSVSLNGQSISFAAGEAIHTEDSHKYGIENFREMAARAGFNPRAVWTDTERLFSIHWLESR